MPSVMFLLAAVLVATDATVVSRLYSGSGLQDKAFTQNVVFTSPAKNAPHCAVLCNQHESCETFTFEQDLCRGHALEMTAAASYESAAGARSFSYKKLDIDECVSAPCQNGGTCVDQVNGYLCQCALGYTDTQCQTEMKKNCKEETKRGVVTIYPDNSTPLQVYCDQNTDGGGWTVFQRRQDASVDFYRNWTSYQNFFGDLTGNFWLGLDTLHMLTSKQRYELRVDLMKWDNTTGYATYSDFSISNNSDNYRMNFGHFTGGNAGDSLFYQRALQFSTWDRDHSGNCAQHYHGAWWYKHCHFSNLNGEYKPNSTAQFGQGICWYHFGGYYYSQKFSEMKIRVV